MRERHWYIVGCYLALGYRVTIWYVAVAMKERPRGEELVFVGDYNVHLEGTDIRGQVEDILEAIATSGPEDLAEHFLPRRREW